MKRVNSSKFLFKSFLLLAPFASFAFHLLMPQFASASPSAASAESLNNDVSKFKDHPVLTSIGVISIMKKTPSGDSYELVWVQSASDSKKTYISPIFIDTASANQWLRGIQSSGEGASKSSDGFVKVLSNMGQIKSMSWAASQLPSSSGVNFITPLMLPPADTEKAISLLKNQGFSDAQISEKLAVPVFYTEPMLNMTTSVGKREVFFFSKDQLDELVNKQLDPSARKQIKYKVTDLMRVINLMTSSNGKDKYVFFPTKAAVELNPGLVTD